MKPISSKLIKQKSIPKLKLNISKDLAIINYVKELFESPEKIPKLNTTLYKYMVSGNFGEVKELSFSLKEKKIKVAYFGGLDNLDYLLYFEN